MPPPRIRTEFGPNDHTEPSQRPQTGWLGSLRNWGQSKARQQQRRVPAAEASAEAAADDLVCLSPLSQFFCNVDNPPDIYANMTLAGHCSLEDLVPPMQHMADLHDRFRRRLVYRSGAWRAEVLENFDVRSLMREVTLDGPDAQQAYHAYMAKLMSDEPLGCQVLPPWDVLCIHYTCNPQRTDVLMRASHIIGDGQLFMKLIKQIMEPLDAAARADYHASITHARAGTPGVGRARLAGGKGSSGGGASSSGGGRSSGGGGSFSSSGGGSSCGGRVGDGSSSGAGGGKQQQQQQQRSSSSMLPQQQLKQRRQQLQQEEVAQALLDSQQQQQRKKQGGPKHWWRLFVRLMQWCWAQYTAVLFSWCMLFWFADPVTVIKASEAQCAGRRCWGSTTISLQEFHRTARTLGHTLNTLAVSCLAGGVRRYLLRHGATPVNRIRMCGMVDTRSMPGLESRMQGASNNFSFIGVPLFTGEVVGPLQRLERVGRAMAWVRHSVVVPIALHVPEIIQTIFRHPVASSKAILRALPLKTTIGFSNMKGPAGSWSLSGYKVTNIHNGVQPMAFGSFISLFSYDTHLTFTHTCYETKTKKPEVLLECILEEYQCLRKAASIGSSAAGSSGGLDSPNYSEGAKIKAG